MKNKLNWLNNIASNEIKFNLGAGVPPLDSYPSFNPRKLFDGESLNSSDESLNYHRTAGFIINTAEKVLKVNEGIDFKADNIIITNGVQEAIALALACFRKRLIACLDPSYPGLEDAANTFGCNLIKLPLENWLTKLETLPEGSLFYLSADFSNPTGISLSMDERIQLINIAARNKFYIFDDATYRPFNLDNPLPSLISLNDEYVIHAISFSKILAPGLRTAFVYLPESLKNFFIQHKSNLSLNSSGVTQRIIKNWLHENNYQLSAHLKSVKNRLKLNRKVTEKHGIKYNGGFFCIFELNRKADFTFCEELLKSEQIAVVPMCLFTENIIFERQVRLSLSKITDDVLDQLLIKIKQFEP